MARYKPVRPTVVGDHFDRVEGCNLIVQLADVLGRHWLAIGAEGQWLWWRQPELSP
jgi:hypothetical protein